MYFHPYWKDDYDERYPGRPLVMKYDYPDGVRIMPAGRRILMRTKNFDEITFDDIKKAGLVDLITARTVLAKDRPLSAWEIHH